MIFVVLSVTALIIGTLLWMDRGLQKRPLSSSDRTVRAGVVWIILLAAACGFLLSLKEAPAFGFLGLCALFFVWLGWLSPMMRNCLKWGLVFGALSVLFGRGHGRRWY